MAETTDGGHYYRATNKNSLEEIFKQIDKIEKTKIDVTQYRQTKEEFKIFLLLALIALGLELILRIDN